MTSKEKLAAGAGSVVAVLLLFGLAGTCHRDPNVNEELARATRVAVEAAREARAENDAAYMLPGRYRLLAVAIGVAVPAAVAVVVMYLSLRHRPEIPEVDAEECRQRHLAAAELRPSIDQPTDHLPVAAGQPEPSTISGSPPTEGSDQEPAADSTAAPPSSGTTG